MQIQKRRPRKEIRKDTERIRKRKKGKGRGKEGLRKDMEK
jgi:hypothetical protein